MKTLPIGTAAVVYDGARTAKKANKRTQIEVSRWDKSLWLVVTRHQTDDGPENLWLRAVCGSSREALRKADETRDDLQTRKGYAFVAKRNVRTKYTCAPSEIGVPAGVTGMNAAQKTLADAAYREFRKEAGRTFLEIIATGGAASKHQALFG